MEITDPERTVVVVRPARRARQARPSRFYARYGKRALDLVVAWAVLALTAPLLATIALAVRLDSPGPALFAQERLGQDARPFRLYKFRTMRADADPALHAAHVRRLIAANTTPEVGSSLKLAHDPRITRVGRWLRRTSLDELPQFWNVVRGEMSVVGPRPDVAYAVEAYPAWWRGRFRGMPGITGLWQVEARNRVSYEAMIGLDLAYFERMSLGLDLALIARTPWSMLHGAGAG